MSHFTVFLSKIGNLTPELLQKAIELFVQSLPVGTRIFYQQIPDYYGNMKSVIVGFQTPSMHYPIGFKLENGVLAVAGDGFGAQQEFDRFKEMAMSGQITNAYLIALRAQQENMTMQMSVVEDKIVLEMEVN